jgi:hypothetical protein
MICSGCAHKTERGWGRVYEKATIKWVIEPGTKGR